MILASDEHVLNMLWLRNLQQDSYIIWKSKQKGTVRIWLKYLQRFICISKCHYLFYCPRVVSTHPFCIHHFFHHPCIHPSMQVTNKKSDHCWNICIKFALKCLNKKMDETGLINENLMENEQSCWTRSIHPSCLI